MPFLKKKETPAGVIGIWQIAESSTELLPTVQLSESEKKSPGIIKNEKRKREFLAVRALIKKIIDTDSTIIYENSGRPRLKNSKKNISISHSAELAVVFLSDRNAGIDVENTNRNIAPLVKRFLLKEELEQTENSSDKQLMQTIYWSAKEAIFKCTSEEKILFNRQIHIHPFTLNNEGNFRGELKIKNRTFYFDISYFRVGNNVVVYCVEM